MTFQDDLNFPLINNVNEDICEARLYSRMQVDFGLLQYDCGTLRCVVTQRDYRQDLRDAKADISNEHFGSLGMAPYPYLEQLATFGDGPYFKA